jgi:putative transposase
MLKVLRYRVYPTKAQKTTMNNTLELCRWTYNETLALERHGSYIKEYRYYDSKKTSLNGKKT